MQLTAHIQSIRKLNPDVSLVCLQLPTAVAYQPGQYLTLVLPSGLRCSYSIANSANKAGIIELHIRETPGSDDSRQVSAALRGAALTIEIPQGKCVLKPITKPTIFLAASTGFAQLKCMLESCFHQSVLHPLYLYWGGNAAIDLYLSDLAKQWQQQYNFLHYVPVVNQPLATETWEGRRGFVHKALLEDFKDLSNIEIYASGSPGFIYAVFDDLLAHGMPQQAMHSDVFDYAPRK